jgi:hypothetical protein
VEIFREMKAHEKSSRIVHPEVRQAFRSRRVIAVKETDVAILIVNPFPAGGFCTSTAAGYKQCRVSNNRRSTRRVCIPLVEDGAEEDEEVLDELPLREKYGLPLYMIFL